MAVTFGAAVILGRRPDNWPAIEDRLHRVARCRPSGFCVPTAGGALFTGWRCGPPPRRTDDVEPAHSTPGDGALSYAVSPGVSVICDARCDNRPELAAQLGAPPSGSTAELLALGYATWGERLPEHIYGDFAAVVWDAAAGAVHLVRDQVGVKPLYYAQHPGSWLAAASDVGFLLDLGFAPREIDETALGRYVAFKASDDHRTFFAAVSRVPSATIVSATASTLRSHRYWHLPAPEPIRFRSRRDCLDRFDELLSRAVGRRLGPGPVGAHLSGGLDSTGIATVAARQLARSGESLTTWSLTSPPSETGAYPTELPWIEVALDWLEGAESHIIFDDRPFALDDDGLVGRPRSSPCGPGEIELRRLMATRGVATVLSGWGGDEIVTAPITLPDLVRAGCWRSVREEMRGRRGWGVPALAAAVLPDGPHRSRAHRRDPRTVSPSGADQAERRLLRLGVSPRFAPAVLAAAVGRLQPVPGDHQDRMRVRLEAGHLQQRIEEWAEADRLNGIECAYPLLDRELLEFVVAVPADQLHHGGRSRSLMRDVLDGRTGDAVRERRDKTGALSNPIERWASHEDAYEPRIRRWADSELVRDHLDPDLLLASLHWMVAAAGPGQTPIEMVVRPVISSLVTVASFLAAVDDADRVDQVDRPATAGAPEARTPSEAR